MASDHGIARFVFLRILALCLAFGFAALFEQAPGLIGENGITPLREIMAQWQHDHGAAAYWQAPSLFWLSSAEWFVLVVALLGLAAAALLFFGIAPRWCCITAYIAWLSFRAIDGGIVRWFNFPFDDLQTETVFLAIFIAPAVRWPWQRPPPLPRWVHWLVIWLLFRLLFGPGLAKVLFHPPWLELTAIGQFLVTMPHPTPAAAWFHDLGPLPIALITGFTLGCELICPPLFFVPGWPRRIAAAIGIALMFGIQLVCNIRGFQLLTVGLLLLLWDDASLRRLLPARWRRERQPPAAPPPPRPWRRAAAAITFTALVAATIRPTLAAFQQPLARFSPTADAAAHAIAPLHLAGGYVMFCVMPDERLGLVVQGSRDGENWLDYRPRHLPTAVDHAPIWFAPYHDYLGFRLWLAPFCLPNQDGWLRALQQRLLAGEPSVEALFADVPFAPSPPEQVRVAVCRFQFAPAAARRSGTFWQRELMGIRVPAARRGE
ncbi:MAG: lipase maturation factor family protein [Planctomycetes bacterium]|nr:lipase maturation factor family protein [Planctomycetota bacterium]